MRRRPKPVWMKDLDHPFYEMAAEAGAAKIKEAEEALWREIADKTIADLLESKKRPDGRPN